MELAISRPSDLPSAVSAETTVIRRLLAPRVREALADNPVVLIHGPRQSGKTTLARLIGEPRGHRYFTFDDDAIRASAERDPIGFIAELPARSILDEVQRVPALFTALKADVDRRRTPGRFILTGSANVLVVPALADSLAGRMGLLRLHPLSQCEIEGSRPRFLDSLFGKGFPSRVVKRLGDDLYERIVGGGYPAALQRRRTARRGAWYRDYVETQVQRDVRDLSRLRSFEALPRLLALASNYTARLLNVTELAGPFNLTRQTIHEYVTLLERVFLVDRLPSWHTNQLSRLVKTPKLHMGDTGIACALLGLGPAQLRGDRSTIGPMLETFVFQELRRQAAALPEPVSLFHYRDRDDFEVDIVIERGASAVAGVEVKAGASVSPHDLRGLRKLREAAGHRFVRGVVLYDGEAAIDFGDRLQAVPIRALWES